MPPFTRQTQAEESLSTIASFTMASSPQHSTELIVDAPSSSSCIRREISPAEDNHHHHQRPQENNPRCSPTRVCFDETNIVIHKIDVLMIKSDAWYKKDDYKQMRARDAEILEQLKEDSIYIDMEDSAHGLERKLQDQSRKLSVLYAVLMEQESQQMIGVNDPERIAQAARLENSSASASSAPTLSLLAGQWDVGNDEEDEITEAFDNSATLSLVSGLWEHDEDEAKGEGSLETTRKKEESCVVTSLLIGEWFDEDLDDDNDDGKQQQEENLVDTREPEHQALLVLRASATWSGGKKSKGEVRVETLVRLVLLILTILSYRIVRGESFSEESILAA